MRCLLASMLPLSNYVHLEGDVTTVGMRTHKNGYWFKRKISLVIRSSWSSPKDVSWIRFLWAQQFNEIHEVHIRERVFSHNPLQQKTAQVLSARLNDWAHPHWTSILVFILVIKREPHSLWCPREPRFVFCLLKPRFRMWNPFFRRFCNTRSISRLLRRTRRSFDGMWQYA